MILLLRGCMSDVVFKGKNFKFIFCKFNFGCAVQLSRNIKIHFGFIISLFQFRKNLLKIRLVIQAFE
jgi:hypothetical protein